METIYDAGHRVSEAARWDTLQVGNTYDYIEMFEAGVEFAQRWIPIERDKDGLTTQEQDDYFLNNVPFLVKSEYGIELFDGLDIELENEEFTYWRPIELK